MRLSEDFLSELKYRNDIETVISSYVNLKRSGSTLKGLCPFHNEKTPSFVVYPENGSYYCFGCANGGDVVTFIRNAENLDYMEAVKFLAERSGMNMPDTGYDDSAEKLRRTLAEINRETARFYHQCLLDKTGEAARAYLKDRQLSSATIKHFGIGFSPDSGFSLCNHLKSKGYKESDCVLANVIGIGRSGRPYDRFRGRVIFPIIDLRGNVIGFGGRVMPGAEGAKYLNTSDTPIFKKSRNMYALNFAKNTKEDFVILAEGYMDVIALHQAGFTSAVAALGTSFTEDQAVLLSRYTKEVVVTMDTDEAGRRATERALSILKKTGLKVRVLQVEGGKDPDEYIKTYGAERFRLLLSGACNDIEFRILKARSGFDLNSDHGKVNFLTEAAKILADTPDEIAKNVYAGRLASELSVDKQVILNQADKIRKKNITEKTKKKIQSFTGMAMNKDPVNPEAVRHKRAAAAEETILALLMFDLKLANEAQPADNLFITAFHKRIYQALSELAKKGLQFDITLLSGEFSAEEMGRIVLLQNKPVAKDRPLSAFEDCILVLKQENELLHSASPDKMDNNEWAEAIKKLGNQKGSSAKKQ